MQRSPAGLVVAIVILASACMAPILAMAQQAPDERCFVETGHCVDGRFRAFWEQNGGEAVLGFPLGPASDELVGGTRVRAQWFERARLEVDPNGAPPNDVVLGRLGPERLQMSGRDWQALPPGQPRTECLAFESRHTLCPPFLDFWRAQGLELDGVPGISELESRALFGMPISEPEQMTVDGAEVTVQWFERARFELRGDGVVAAPLGSELFPKLPPTFVPPAPSPAPTGPGSSSSPPPGPGSGSGSGSSSGGGAGSPSVPNVAAQDRPGVAPVPSKSAVKVVNNTGGPVRLTLEGPTSRSLTLADGQELQPDVEAGTYQVTVSTSCGVATESFTLSAGALKEIVYSCEGTEATAPPPPTPTPAPSARVQLVNQTGAVARFTLDGPSPGNWSIGDGVSQEMPALPGQYQVSVVARCGAGGQSLTVEAGATAVYTAECIGLTPHTPVTPPKPEGAGTLSISNNTGGTITVTVSGASEGTWSIGPGAAFNQPLPAGDYQMTVRARCGSTSESFRIVRGSTPHFSYTCVG